MVDLHSSREAGSAQGPPSATERRECKSRVTPLRRTLQGRRASASAAPGLDGHEEASREEMAATLGVLE